MLKTFWIITVLGYLFIFAFSLSVTIKKNNNNANLLPPSCSYLGQKNNKK